MAAAKVPTNVSVRADLVKAARAFQINISEVLEAALEREVRQRERARWLEENEDAIDGYNARVADHGVFSDAWRKF